MHRFGTCQQNGWRWQWWFFRSVCKSFAPSMSMKGKSFIHMSNHNFPSQTIGNDATKRLSKFTSYIYRHIESELHSRDWLWSVKNSFAGMKQLEFNQNFWGMQCRWNKCRERIWHLWNFLAGTRPNIHHLWKQETLASRSSIWQKHTLVSNLINFGY